MKTSKFALGQLLLTPGAIEALQEAGQSPPEFLRRHATGDWGDVSAGDARLNDEDADTGGRLLSAYRTAKGRTLWIVTEADRSATTIRLPDEYERLRRGKGDEHDHASHDHHRRQEVPQGEVPAGPA